MRLFPTFIVLVHDCSVKWLTTKGNIVTLTHNGLARHWHNLLLIYAIYKLQVSCVMRSFVPGIYCGVVLVKEYLQGCLGLRKFSVYRFCQNYNSGCF